MMSDYELDFEQLELGLKYVMQSDEVQGGKNLIIALLLIVCLFFLYVVFRDMFKRF